MCFGNFISSEPLESRRMLSGTFHMSADGLLTITGDDAPNSIALSNNKFDDSGEPTAGGTFRSKLVVDGAMQLFPFGMIKKVVAKTAGGNDWIWISLPAEAVIDAGKGNDTVSYAPGGVEFHMGEIHGGSGNDSLFVTGGQNTVYGDSGDDTLQADDSRTFDVLRGGDGNDLLKIVNAGSNALFGDNGNDTLLGGAGNDFLSGLSGNDSLRGGSGNDSLDGGIGADVLRGDRGTDTADYSHRTDNLNLSLDDHDNDGAAGEHDNVRSDVENILGGSGNDKLVGNPFANLLKGNSGNDTIWAGAGNDTLDGGGGRDLLFGQDGNDHILAKDGRTDSIDGGAGYDTVQRDKTATIKDQVLNAEVVG